MVRHIDLPAPFPPPINFTKSIAIKRRHTHLAPPFPSKTTPNTAHPRNPCQAILCCLIALSNQINNSEVCVGVGAKKKKKKSIVAASRPSQNGRSRSGLKRWRNRSPRHSTTMKWQRRSGSTRPIEAAPTAARRSRSGRQSIWVWSSVRNAQVRNTGMLLCFLCRHTHAGWRCACCW